MLAFSLSSVHVNKKPGALSFVEDIGAAFVFVQKDGMVGEKIEGDKHRRSSVTLNQPQLLDFERAFPYWPSMTTCNYRA